MAWEVQKCSNIHSNKIIQFQMQKFYIKAHELTVSKIFLSSLLSCVFSLSFPLQSSSLCTYELDSVESHTNPLQSFASYWFFNLQTQSIHQQQDNGNRGREEKSIGDNRNLHLHQTVSIVICFRIGLIDEARSATTIHSSSAITITVHRSFSITRTSTQKEGRRGRAIEVNCTKEDQRIWASNLSSKIVVAVADKTKSWWRSISIEWICCFLFRLEDI